MGVLIMADESASVPEDVIALARHRAVDSVSIYGRSRRLGSSKKMASIAEACRCAATSAARSRA